MSRRGHRFSFFLTPAEQVVLLEAFEARYQLAFYRAGTFSTPEAPALSSLLEEALLEHLTLGDWNQSPERVLVRCESNQQRVKQKNKL